MDTYTRLACMGLCAALVAAFSPAALADDVEDQVKEAMQAYKDKDYAMAAQGLEMAAQLVRQKRGEGLTKFLPEPLKGWRAEKAETQAAGVMLFGGGTSASRSYRKGGASITVQFVTDSPILQTYLMMLGSPMMASASGAKLERLKGQRAIVNAEDLSIHIVVGGVMLVSVDGDDCELDDLRAYAAVIDYDALAKSL